MGDIVGVGSRRDKGGERIKKEDFNIDVLYEWPLSEIHEEACGFPK
jgi:hypothetical protein